MSREGGLDTASAMIATPLSPNRPSEVFGGPQDFIARLSPGCCPLPDNGLLANHDRGLPGFGIATGGNDGMGSPVGDRVMTSTGVIGTICRNRAYPLIFGYLVQ